MNYLLPLPLVNHKIREMKRNVLYFMLICLAIVTNAKADNNRIYDLVDGQDYYIYSIYYERVLSPSSDNTYPCLVEY